MALAVVGKDKRSTTVGDLPITDNGYIALLPADFDSPVTVPAGYDTALVSSDKGVYIAGDEVVTLPTSSATATQKNYHFLPAGSWVVTVADVDVLHLKARAETDYSVSFYQFGGR